MGGLAQLAKAAGHEVSGSDRRIYPPMSTQLEQAGIDVQEGYDPGQLDVGADQVVVGNVMRRGQPIIETMLNHGIDYISGPEWLAAQMLHDRWVLAVSGTHGKTTTSSMLAYILDQAGLNPSFLIGGVPLDFGVSARLIDSPFFVIEADEYDTAFFDKRSKFLHYHPRTLIMNNLEYDHADIFPDIESIQRQFHHLVRTVPGNGLIISPQGNPVLEQTLAMGCWTPVEHFGAGGQIQEGWMARLLAEDGGHFEIGYENTVIGSIKWHLLGYHNVTNALAALLAARHVGVPIAYGIEVLAGFSGVARRLQRIGEIGGITIYDDFAHHPTAIATTLAGLHARKSGNRLIAVLEPRSNSMRMGTHRQWLAQSLKVADIIYYYQPANLSWSIAELTEALGNRINIEIDLGHLLDRLLEELKKGDQIVFMSNGSFGGLPLKIYEALRKMEY